jgi:ribosome recycling factor
MKEAESEKLISEDDHYRGKARMQELIDEYVEKIDDIGEAKEEQIMEV